MKAFVIDIAQLVLWFYAIGSMSRVIHLLA